MIVKIKRQSSPDAAPYWQSFSYNGPMHVTVSAVLDAINYTDDLYDTEGNPAKRVRWECSCLQAVCGGCAMIINGVPALACNTFIDEVTKTDLTTGEQLASCMSKEYSKAEYLYGNTGAVDEITLALAEQLGIQLSELNKNYLRGKTYEILPGMRIYFNA